MNLSDRIRPDVEAAPWVVDEIRSLEARLESAISALDTAVSISAEARKDERIAMSWLSEVRAALGPELSFDKLVPAIEELRGLKPELPPRSNQDDRCQHPALPRYGVRWNGPTEPMAVPMVTGYWTPFHLALDALAGLEAAAIIERGEKQKLVAEVERLTAAFQRAHDQAFENGTRAHAAEARLRELASAEPDGYAVTEAAGFTACFYDYAEAYEHAQEAGGRPIRALIRRPEMPS